MVMAATPDPLKAGQDIKHTCTRLNMAMTLVLKVRSRRSRLMSRRSSTAAPCTDALLTCSIRQATASPLMYGSVADAVHGRRALLQPSAGLCHEAQCTDWTTSLII